MSPSLLFLFSLSPFFLSFYFILFTKKKGQGAFGAIRRATFRGTTVAIKVLYRGTNDQKTILMFQQEAELMIQLRHPNVVSCLGVVMPDCITSNGASVSSASNSLSDFSLVMEFLPTDLKHYIKDTGGLCRNLFKTTLLKIARGIIIGLNYLHQRTPKIIHRDLKPANILLTDASEPRLADFGVSREKVETSTMTRIGTPTYMAPEILQAQKYNEKVDIYSFGMILWQMVSGRPPFSSEPAAQANQQENNNNKDGQKNGDNNNNNDDDDEQLNPLQIILKASIQGLRPTIPSACPSPLVSIIQSCWDKDPAIRPDASFLVKFFQSVVL
jgi:serine/threonine protein kinase